MVNRKELIEKLDVIPTTRLQAAAFKATLRLHLWFTGRTHELMLDFTDRARGVILKAGGSDQILDAAKAYGAQSDLLRLWSDTWTQWQAEFQQARREAARIAFGVQAASHMRLVASEVEKLKVESYRSDPSTFNMQPVTESKVTDGVYDPQLRILLQVAEDYLYGDGLNLSGRIWQIDREAREQMNLILLNGIASQKSAWDIAQELEALLGAGKDCPRWTSTRLYDRTKTEIAAGDVTGLIRGEDCAGQGVSYNALRLARTEIQKMHALATDRLMAQQPWVEQEKVNLSAAHPETDICDDVVAGGEDGQGIYPKGEIELPLHPNCLCYKTAVLMDREQFVSQMRDWLNGGSWAEMDAYAEELGAPIDADLTPAMINIAVWLFSDELDDWMK
ncbi:MAG: hypothetical protein DYG85_06430 [Chloroflexi bacterium CFX1]|nr:putative head morphogenesis protein [Virus Rctr41k]MCE7919141.1 hypothetical protein [Chloroflexi bacterium CFX1]